MNKLNTKQTTYIFAHAKRITDKYMMLTPLSYEDCLRLKEEALKVIHDSKDDPMCELILMDVYECLGKIKEEDEK